MKKYLLCLSWLLASCTAHRSVPGSSSASFQETAKPLPDHIVFLTLNISRDSLAKQSEIHVLQTVSKEGSLKRDTEPEPHQGPQLKCELLAGEAVTDSFFVEHPLFRDIEYLNEQHTYARKEVQLRSEDFFIRFRQGKAHSIRISELLPGTTMQELLTIKLP